MSSLRANQNRMGAIALLVAASGVSSCGSPIAEIDDVSVKGNEVSLLAVDGRSPVRAGSKYLTVVPVARVSPGRHEFRVLWGRKIESPGETLTVTATVASGKRYAFKRVGHEIQLVEAPRLPNR